MADRMSDTDIQLGFKGVNDTLVRVEEKVDRSNTKLDYTNGKVGAVIAWQQRAIGAGWAFGLCLVVIIVPIAGWTLYNQVTEEQRIQDAVSNTITNQLPNAIQQALANHSIAQ